ncbi:MAG: alpha-hydroxy-acid oxidizing protein [Actinobacteria bacterium]|nr:alpha-hydroxy-acid oxidizing protein [Actinomycetota bacterium]MBU1943892.1 alpha-hydroxy-acid oxidizing protein [Actinomycetota bacterium]MBU2688586.1 alpha-hydroxy-acid oxidizing protein [Actinomycetota bacterium]
MVTSEFLVDVDHQRCRRCKRCILNCGFGVFDFQSMTTADSSKCVACHRCVVFCPEEAITIRRNPLAFREHSSWDVDKRKAVWKQAQSPGMILTGMGNDLPWLNVFDHLLIDACQVTNPSIDPLREPMELRTFLGRKPDRVEVVPSDGGYRVQNPPENNIELDIPLIFSGMSYGSVSLNVHKALAIAAEKLGTVMNTGEGGLHQELYPYRDHIIVQCASGRFGVHSDYLNAGVAVEIKIGQGAKPGIGGHLPGEKIGREVSGTRMIPVGTDALSPAPHHDIYSIEDLRQLIYALKEATGYKPISVKIATVHNVAAIASGIARAGADIIYLDGFRGGTGASPAVIRDHVGIPVEIAVAVVDAQLRSEGIRNWVSIIAAGGVRSSADVAKAIALGADAVGVGTAALIAMGCRLCQKCYTGNCSWGIATQKPELVGRLDPDWAAERLVNLVNSWSLELKEVLGALGVNAIESLRGNRERLRSLGLDAATTEIIDVKPAGR